MGAVKKYLPLPLAGVGWGGGGLARSLNVASRSPLVFKTYAMICFGHANDRSIRRVCSSADPIALRARRPLCAPITASPKRGLKPRIPLQIAPSGAPYVIDQGKGIIGQHVAAPSDMTIGTHQNERFLVNGRGSGVVEIDDLQWNAPLRRGSH